MAAPADGGLLHRATALVPSLASADPCARPATQLLTLLWKDSLRSCLFSVPMSRFSFCSPQFRLFDVFRSALSAILVHAAIHSHGPVGARRPPLTSPGRISSTGTPAK